MRERQFFVQIEKDFVCVDSYIYIERERVCMCDRETDGEERQTYLYNGLGFRV